ncbi:MAG TPA: hypothetical protein VFU99_03005 [Gaiellaceae bacterium]|nr:hypothetical protein [Gaiellaceae bacterium]
MIQVARRICPVALALALAPAPVGASAERPPVALTASPAQLSLPGAARASIRITNRGSSRTVVDVSRAGFALDLRGRPRIVSREEVRRSAAGWLTFRPRSLALKPGGSAEVAVVSKPPAGVEPGDHDALLLFTTRRRGRDGVAVRMRMGVVVVVRAPGTVVRRLALGRFRVRPTSRARILEIGVANRGNVTETLGRTDGTLSLFRGSRRLALLRVEPRDLRPGTRGVLQFVYRGATRGSLTARVDLLPSGLSRAVRRTFRVRL